MRPGLLLLIVVLNARAGKLSVVGLAFEVMVTKFVLLLLLFWGKGNRNGFVKIITAPLIFNLFGL
jgi:Na+(H+)/acetate symporter ActP